ncbi:MAG TPA: flagellar hook-basal body complex protein FliE [Bacillaceae bacterium]|nr:flagellar hook-basal body complex protein FliE [Paenibacillus bovis]HLU21908.1 flagellar hook-basal body complex protein FliE [Bacillaceae bacterium]
MAINSVSIANLQPINLNNNSKQLSKKSQVSFNEILKAAVNNVNDAQVQSDIATEKLIKGEKIELHDVMITAQKASISLQLAMEVRNKAVEAYQEMMRMQV